MENKRLIFQEISKILLTFKNWPNSLKFKYLLVFINETVILLALLHIAKDISTEDNLSILIITSVKFNKKYITKKIPKTNIKLKQKTKINELKTAIKSGRNEKEY